MKTLLSWYRKRSKGGKALIIAVLLFLPTNLVVAVMPYVPSAFAGFSPLMIVSLLIHLAFSLMLPVVFFLALYLLVMGRYDDLDAEAEAAQLMLHYRRVRQVEDCRVSFGNRYVEYDGMIVTSKHFAMSIDEPSPQLEQACFGFEKVVLSGRPRMQYCIKKHFCKSDKRLLIHTVLSCIQKEFPQDWIMCNKRNALDNVVMVNGAHLREFVNVTCNK